MKKPDILIELIENEVWVEGLHSVNHNTELFTKGIITQEQYSDIWRWLWRDQNTSGTHVDEFN